MARPELMAAARTHIFRLLKWGRILARHGALTLIEQAPETPAGLRRLCRLARFGARVPKVPNYAAAFEAIGPAAIKLGQTLATRPDMIGADVAQDLLRLQDAVPPAPFEAARAVIESALGKPLDALFSSFDPVPVGAASIAQVYRAVTLEGRPVAVKVLRPGIIESFTRDIETYEWAAAQIAGFGGEVARLRPAQVIAQFRQWTMRELDLRREAASASELAQNMAAETDYIVPAIDWQRTARRVLTLDWIEGIKLNDIPALEAAGHDRKKLARTLIHAFLRQAIVGGFFHADIHQGNLFVRHDGKIVAIDFGIMGRVNRQARLWLAEILHGLITGNYRRVAEIHFEAQYVPAHHNVDEFATALRSVGEPIRGRPVNEISVGGMLDGLFAITRDFDMQTQPHLLLLQKTMVMVEGVATALDPDINMWETSGPLVAGWLRDELGPEARLAEAVHEAARFALRLPDLVARVERAFPKPGAAPPGPPLPEIALWRPRVGLWLLGALIAAAAFYGWLHFIQ